MDTWCGGTVSNECTQDSLEEESMLMSEWAGLDVEIDSSVSTASLSEDSSTKLSGLLAEYSWSDRTCSHKYHSVNF